MLRGKLCDRMLLYRFDITLGKNGNALGMTVHEQGPMSIYPHINERKDVYKQAKISCIELLDRVI